MRTKLLLIVVAVSLVCVGVGCSKGGAGKTPQDTVMNLKKALEKNDGKGFVACFDATEKQQKMLTALFDVAQASRKLNKAVEKAFGEEGADKFFEGDDEPFNMLEDLSKDDLVVKEDGDKATVTMKDSDADPMDLVKKDGKWFIVFDMDEPSDEDMEKSMKMFEAMAGVYEDMAKKAGDDGMTVEKLKAAMGEAMMGVMAGMMGGGE